MQKPYAVLLCLFLASTLLARCQSKAYELSQHQFNFKGFATTIADFATDEQGNHLLVGWVDVVADLKKDRDTTLNRIFRLKDKGHSRKLGIVIATDQNFNIKQISRSFVGRKVIYDARQKQFIIGASFFSYIVQKDDSFSAWQPIIIKTKIDLKQTAYLIKQPHSCLLEDIKLEGDNVLVFAHSFLHQSILQAKREAVDVFRVNTARHQVDTTYGWMKNLEILQTWRTNHAETGGLTMSKVSQAKGGYYFSTSTFDQSEMKTTQHLYKFANGSLTELPRYQSLLKFSAGLSKRLSINDMALNAKNQLVTVCHEVASDETMVYMKTDINASKVLAKKDIPLHYYADVNRFCVLSNDHLVVLQHNPSKTWSYYFYDQNLNLLQEVKAKVSKDHVPYALFESDEGIVSATFTVNNKSQKDCVVQQVPFKK